MTGIEKLVNDIYKGKLKPDLKDLQDEAVIDSAVNPKELLQYMQKDISGINRQKVLDLPDWEVLLRHL